MAASRASWKANGLRETFDDTIFAFRETVLRAARRDSTNVLTLAQSFADGDGVFNLL